MNSWEFDSILTSMHTSEAFSTTKKNHMHTEDIAREGSKLVAQLFGLILVCFKRVLFPKNVLPKASFNILLQTLLWASIKK